VFIARNTLPNDPLPSISPFSFHCRSQFRLPTDVVSSQECVVCVCVKG
jgi:hypothetical protein